MTALLRKTLVIGSVAAAATAATMAAAVWMTSRHVEAKSFQHLYDDIESLPRRDVGLVLGTSPNTKSGSNEFYAARIEAAAAIFHSGKIGHIIVSGSNPSRYYNEPFVMKRDLVQRAVPPERITEDYAGFRTLDSIVRADKVMGQRSFTVVTQRFHAARAVYLGLHYGLDVIGFCAEDPADALTYAAHLREYGARFKALLDLTLLDTQPRYLGEPVEIELPQLGRESELGAATDRR